MVIGVDAGTGIVSEVTGGTVAGAEGGVMIASGDGALTVDVTGWVFAGVLDTRTSSSFSAKGRVDEITAETREGWRTSILRATGAVVRGEGMSKPATVAPGVKVSASKQHPCMNDMRKKENGRYQSSL